MAGVLVFGWKIQFKEGLVAARAGFLRWAPVQDVGPMTTQDGDRVT